ncbi:MAG TPA: nitroreductase family protein [Candidatus Bathyarchaeia archaeon]|nr:nitroreductase family protein [Candidatus Bathyarchaeia archaeon]
MKHVSQFTQEENAALDRILESRRSIRAFTPDTPPKEEIAEIIRAGLLAPYPGLRVAGDVYFRRFVVIEKGSLQLAKVAEIAKRQVKARAEQLKRQLSADPALRHQGQGFVRRLERLAQIGVPGIGTAPYFIVVAEQRGFPPVEQESLAHCLENMWLKATALGLGFHLVSATAQLGHDEEFCSLLDIPHGEFGTNGCAIGYPRDALPPASHPTVDEVTTWIE